MQNLMISAGLADARSDKELSMLSRYDVDTRLAGLAMIGDDSLHNLHYVVEHLGQMRGSQSARYVLEGLMARMGELIAQGYDGIGISDLPTEECLVVWDDDPTVIIAISKEVVLAPERRSWYHRLINRLIARTKVTIWALSIHWRVLIEPIIIEQYE